MAFFGGRVSKNLACIFSSFSPRFAQNIHIIRSKCFIRGVNFVTYFLRFLADWVGGGTTQDPPLPVPVLGLLFESFMSRFVSRWFVDDEIEALLVSYRVFRVSRGFWGRKRA